jgi:hypothetical protein
MPAWIFLFALVATFAVGKLWLDHGGENAARRIKALPPRQRRAAMGAVMAVAVFVAAFPAWLDHKVQEAQDSQGIPAGANPVYRSTPTVNLEGNQPGPPVADDSLTAPYGP